MTTRVVPANVNDARHTASTACLSPSLLLRHAITPWPKLTRDGPVWLPVHVAHARLQAIGAGRRQHCADSQDAERVEVDSQMMCLADAPLHGSVRADPARFQDFAGHVLLFEKDDAQTL
jgi:hypothetical protein